MTFPKMTWSISSGPKRARCRASPAAWTARSIAETPANAPLYSAMGVRTPSATTMERDMSVSSGPSRSLRDGGGCLVETAAEGVHVDIPGIRMQAVREEDMDAPHAGIH